MSNSFGISRGLLDHPVWLSESFTRGQAWVDLIGLANFTDSFFHLRGMRVEVRRAQLARGQENLSMRWKWSRGKVQRFLTELKQDNRIELEQDNKITIITICNYDLYQPQSKLTRTAEKPKNNTTNDTANEQQIEQQTGSKRTANRTTDGTHNNKNNNNNKENNKERKRELPDINNLPEWIPTEEFNAFVEMRQKIGKALTSKAILLAIAKLEALKLTGNDPALVLEQSIFHNWQGLFPLKDTNYGNNFKNNRQNYGASGGQSRQSNNKPASKAEQLRQFREQAHDNLGNKTINSNSERLPENHGGDDVNN